MPIRELRSPDLDNLLALYAHLHERDEPLPPRSAVEDVWTEALANPRIRYFGGFEGDALVSSCTITLVPNLTRGCQGLCHLAFRGQASSACAHR